MPIRSRISAGFWMPACIDLKGFTEEYYEELTEGSLGPVLATLKKLKDQKVHTEIVNLIVPDRTTTWAKSGP